MDKVRVFDVEGYLRQLPRLYASVRLTGRGHGANMIEIILFIFIPVSPVDTLHVLEHVNSSRAAHGSDRYWLWSLHQT